MLVIPAKASASSEKEMKMTREICYIGRFSECFVPYDQNTLSLRMSRGLRYLYGGKFFRRMKNGFSRSGYRIYWKILDAKDYGIPQHRERLIIVGARRGLNVEYEFPRKTHGPSLKPYVNLKQAIGEPQGAKAGRIL